MAEGDLFHACSRPTRSAVRPVRRIPSGHETDQEDRKDPRQKNAVEGAGASYGSNGGPEPLDLSEVEHVGPYEGPEAPARIGQGRGVSPRKHEGHCRCDQGGHEHGLSDAHAPHGIGHQVGANGDQGHPDRALHVEPVPPKKVEGEKGGNEGASDIDRNNRPGPMRDLRDHVAHTLERDGEPRFDHVGREPVYGYIHIAPEKREGEQGEHMAAAQAYSLVGIPQNSYLDEENQEDEQEGEEKQEGQGERKVVHGRLLCFGRGRVSGACRGGAFPARGHLRSGSGRESGMNRI